MLLLFFLFIDLYFLIPTVIIQIFIPVAELVIPIEIPTKESIAKKKMHPVILEININECSV